MEVDYEKASVLMLVRQKGRELRYSSFSIRICRMERESSFSG